ncbi:hypothetical protein TDB9533_03243 [Thalassocella blandensis]|nr:hypothetical protein TDB9533_03243 [Thalassocella blandensis]
MKKALLALFAVVAVQGAYANDVSASNPETEATAWVVAAWDAGASKSWAFDPTDSIASHKTMQEFETRVNSLNEHVSQHLDNLLEQKLDALLAGY